MSSLPSLTSTAVLAVGLLFAPPRARRPPPPRPTPAPTAAPAPVSASEEIYLLAREALGRGSFELAVKLFSALEGDPRWESDARFVFNRAQAHRFGGDPGEAVAGFSRYLALEPSAPDAPAVTEQIQKLMAASPARVRSAAVKRARVAFEKLLEIPELARALEEAPHVRLGVRFEPRASGARGEGTAYSFPARAVAWAPPPADAPNTTWRCWVVPVVPVAPPPGLGAPALLLLPPGTAFPVEMGADLVSLPASPRVPQVPSFPIDAGVAAWRLTVVAEVEKAGPPILLSAGRPGTPMADVRSAPEDGAVALGKKRHELPSVATPLVFGPRPARPDARAFPDVPVLVVDLAGREGRVERWAAPIGAFDVVNRFGFVSADRVCVRADGSGACLPAGPAEPVQQ